MTDAQNTTAVDELYALLPASWGCDADVTGLHLWGCRIAGFFEHFLIFAMAIGAVIFLMIYLDDGSEQRNEAMPARQLCCRCGEQLHRSTPLRGTGHATRTSCTDHNAVPLLPRYAQDIQLEEGRGCAHAEEALPSYDSPPSYDEDAYRGTMTERTYWRRRLYIRLVTRHFMAAPAAKRQRWEDDFLNMAEGVFWS